MRLQNRDPAEKAIKWLFRILQLLHVSDEAACFHAEGKVRRDSTAPLLQSLWTGEAVKGVVDLHAAKEMCVIGQKFPVWQVIRIEGTFPVLIVPSGCADKDPMLTHEIVSS